MTLKLIAIESPFNGTPEERARNMRYLAWCIRDALDRGEAPFASHGLYPTAYPEDPEHRAKGIAAGLAMRDSIGAEAFYCDLGVTSGMYAAWNSGLTSGHILEIRLLEASAKEAFQHGEWPPGATVRWFPVEDGPQQLEARKKILVAERDYVLLEVQRAWKSSDTQAAFLRWLREQLEEVLPGSDKAE